MVFIKLLVQPVFPECVIQRNRISGHWFMTWDIKSTSTMNSTDFWETRWSFECLTLFTWILDNSVVCYSRFELARKILNGFSINAGLFAVGMPWFFGIKAFMILILACEQALFLGESREVTRESLARKFSRGSLRSPVGMESLLSGRN